MEIWSFHDTKMKELKELYNKTSKSTQNRLQELLDTFNFQYDTIYNIADIKTKKRINSYIEEWQEKGLLKDYFGVFARNIYSKIRVKNSEILELLIYSAYIEEQSKLEQQELNIFKEDVSYYYNEGINEVRKAKGKTEKYSVIPDAIFLALLDGINSMGYTWNNYIELTIMNNVSQINRQVLINLQQQKELKIDSREFQNIIDRQNKQRLIINGDKISGVVDNELIGLNNLAKVEGIKSIATGVDEQVMFLAVTDENSTDMCQSMNGMKFYINKENEFYRMYGETKNELRNYRIKCKGLVLGLNLPPISHFWHWCRSTITYVIPPIEKEIALTNK